MGKNPSQNSFLIIRFSFFILHYSFLPPSSFYFRPFTMNHFAKLIFVLFFAASLPILAAEISLTHGNGGDCRTFAQAQKLWRSAQKNAQPGETVTVLIGPGDWYFDERIRRVCSGAAPFRPKAGKRSEPGPG